MGQKPTITRFTPCCVIAQLEDAGLNIMASIADVHRHVFNLFSPVIGKDVLLGNISRLPCDEEFVFARFIFLCKLNSPLCRSMTSTLLLCVHISNVPVCLVAHCNRIACPLCRHTHCCKPHGKPHPSTRPRPVRPPPVSVLWPVGQKRYPQPLPL